MGCSVRELLERIDSRELTEWEAFERLEGPIGDARLDQLFAALQATIANVNRSKKSKAYEPQQFLPRWGIAKRSDEPSSDEALARKVKSIHKAMGGR